MRFWWILCNSLTLHHTIPIFNDPETEGFWNHCKKKKQMILIFSTLPNQISQFYSNLFCRLQKLSIWTSVVSFGKELRYCNGKKLFPLLCYPAKSAIIQNEYYCIAFINTFSHFFPSLNYHLSERSDNLSNSGEFKRQTAWDNAVYIHCFLQYYSDTQSVSSWFYKETEIEI